MGLKFRGLIGPKNVGHDVTVQEKQNDTEGQPQGVLGTDNNDKELDPTVQPAGATGSSASSVEEKKELQFGVQVAEATLQVWTREHLIAAYIM
jgi:hypothetical protein